MYQILQTKNEKEIAKMYGDNGDGSLIPALRSKCHFS